MSYEIINYSDVLGTIEFPDDFENELRGKTIEEQVICFAWCDEYNCKGEPYGKIPEMYNLHSVDEKKVIVKDGLVVGFIKTLDKWNSEKKIFEEYDKPFFPFDSYCYDVTSDNNGAGYKERSWYRYLICIPHGTKYE